MSVRQVADEGALPAVQEESAAVLPFPRPGREPLPERPEDVEPLVRHFADMYARKFGMGQVVVPLHVLRALESMAWRGYVRELENAIATMVALSEDGCLRLDALGREGRTERRPREEDAGFRGCVAGYERTLLRAALARAGNNHAQAARSLGLSRTTFLGMLRRHGLEKGGDR